ncbi:MAG: DUF4349 domain-containing protein [Chloroflexi bacterium]|nr:MAG: DUF4349 domain-containing protein [Chloroflexota bacterium]
MNSRTFSPLLQLLVVALAVVAVAACGNLASSTTGGAGGSAGTSGGGAAAGGTASTAKSTAVQPAPNPGDLVPPIAEGPRVIRTANVSVEVANGRFDTTLDRLFSISTGLGGYISGSTASTDTGALRSGTITFQVPTSKFNQALAEVRGLGKIQNFNIGGQDVSQQYIDLQSRLKNAEAQHEAMLALLSQAHTVSEIIAVQNQLGTITGQIEQLKGQIDYYDHATSYSTISVAVHEAAVVARAADSWGFTTSVSNALHGFVNTLDYILVGLGNAGPVVVLLLLGLLAWRFRRRLAL